MCKIRRGKDLLYKANLLIYSPKFFIYKISVEFINFFFNAV